MQRLSSIYERNIYIGKVTISYIPNQGVLEYGDYFMIKYASKDDRLTDVNHHCVIADCWMLIDLLTPPSKWIDLLPPSILHIHITSI